MNWPDYMRIVREDLHRSGAKLAMVGHGPTRAEAISGIEQRPGLLSATHVYVHTRAPGAHGWRVVAFQATPTIAPGQPNDRTALATAKLSSGSTPLAVLPEAREVLKLDEQYVDSDRRNDAAAGKRMETDRYFFVSRFGDAGGTTNPLRDLRLADVRVRTYGDLAVVTGQVQWTDQKGFSPGPLRFTRVWVRQAGQWKVAAEQRTAMTASGPTSH